jgi:preprotein translocase SecF subunit
VLALVRYLPDNPGFGFMKFRKVAFAVWITMMVGSMVLFAFNGLNLGIDFRGGTMIEIRTTDGPADIGGIRETIGTLNLGNIEVQEFGSPQDVLIRVQKQDGGDQAQQVVVDNVRAALGEEGIEYRRFEVVGPRVSGELAVAGTIAVIASLLAILIYIWFRFEWHFAIGAIIATAHDVILTIGLFTVTQLEFNLSSIAAILTIVGYSLNDTVVVYDRVRENLRKYKKMPLPQLLDMSINNTLSRTLMTSVTTLLVLTSLFVLGGEVIRSFTAAMIWGIVIGTFSSIFVAAPILIYLNLRPASKTDAGTPAVEAEMDNI